MEEIIDTLRNTTISPSSKYLFLPDIPFRTSLDGQCKCVVDSAPLNESGDIYHMITYLMLAQYQKKELPKVSLSDGGAEILEKASSSMNSYSQIQRSIQFAKNVGFEEQFLEPVHIHTNLGRTNPLYHGMVSNCSKNHDKTKNTYYIDQKFLTLLISKYFNEHVRDNAVEILNEAYEKWTVNKEKIKQGVMQEIKKYH